MMGRKYSLLPKLEFARGGQPLIKVVFQFRLRDIYFTFVFKFTAV